MKNNSWVENHPFKMGIVASLICIFFGMLIVMITHSNSISSDFPINWSNYFLIVSPMIFIFCFIPPSIIEGINKIRERKS